MREPFDGILGVHEVDDVSSLQQYRETFMTATFG